jgi:hypothetical protein
MPFNSSAKNQKIINGVVVLSEFDVSVLGNPPADKTFLYAQDDGIGNTILKTKDSFGIEKTISMDITINNYYVVSFYSSGDMSVQLLDDLVPIPAVYGNINEASRVLLGSTGLANALVNNFHYLVILITATASPSSNFVIEGSSIFPSCVSMNIMSIDFTGTLSFNINPTSYPVLSELSITLGGCDALSFDNFDIPLLNLVTATLSADSALLDQLINYIYTTTTQNGGYCNFSGWSVSPTSSSLAARNALLARGWSFDFWV